MGNVDDEVAGNEGAENCDWAEGNIGAAIGLAMNGAYDWAWKGFCWVGC